MANILLPMATVADRVHAGEESLTVVSRSVQWRIDIPKIFNEKSSCRRTFTLANCTWCLELIERRTASHTPPPYSVSHSPFRNTTFSKGYTLSMSVLNSGNQSVHAKFVLRIAYTDMTDQSCFSIDEEKKFGSDDCTFEHSKTLAEIHDKRLVIDFEFLEVNISQSNDKEVAYESLGEEEQLRVMATQGLSRMFAESLYADVTINTKNGTLNAHRAVLAAASSVFACMFDNDFKEKHSSTVDIQDMSFESCKAFLSFLYGVLKEEDLRVHKCSLLEASLKYEIANLQKICVARLIEDINLSNVLERLGQAHFYELKNLKMVCFDYLFDLGRVYDIVDDFSRFTLSADQGLATEIIWMMLAKLH